MRFFLNTLDLILEWWQRVPNSSERHISITWSLLSWNQVITFKETFPRKPCVSSWNPLKQTHHLKQIQVKEKVLMYPLGTLDTTRWHALDVLPKNRWDKKTTQIPSRWWWNQCFWGSKQSRARNPAINPSTVTWIWLDFIIWRTISTKKTVAT